MEYDRPTLQSKMGIRGGNMTQQAADSNALTPFVGSYFMMTYFDGNNISHYKKPATNGFHKVHISGRFGRALDPKLGWIHVEGQKYVGSNKVHLLFVF